VAPPRAVPHSDTHKQIIQTNVLAATLLWLATAASVWGSWTHVLIVLGMQVLAIAANLVINRLAFRFGPRAELVRSLFNAISSTLVAVLVGWPAPVWLWPLFNTLAFDRTERNYTLPMVVMSLAVQNAAALIDGAAGIRSIVSIVLTIYAWRISEYRLQIVRDELVRSDQQRAEIERAHATTHAAHELLKAEITVRERMEIELRAAQKLEALGRIASGVAHEINTPIQFVGDSVRFVQAGVEDILSLCRLNGEVRGAGDDVARARAIVAANLAEQEADLPYLLENLPQALTRASDGIDRVALIVRSMKQFAHPDATGRTETDLNQAIEATLTISRHEYKLVADVETELGALPRVQCNPGEINQVLLNIVVNAAHAIASVVGSSNQRGKIRIETRCLGDHVDIAIGDTGTGIPAAIRHRIFDPFFTTKEVGRGTGQGLALARALIENHHGKLTFETELGRGTTFHIRLPIEQPAVLQAAG
jgi:signal transduction histidine kinase